MSKNNPHTITIHHEGRRTEWRAIFGTDTLPIKAPIPHYDTLPGAPNALVYEVDLNAITADQRQRLIAHTATKFGYSTEFVEENLDKLGMPVLANDVTMTSTQIGLLL